MLVMKSVTSPTLASGAVDVTFGEYAKVNSAMAFIDTAEAAASGVFLNPTVSIAGYTVTVTIDKITLTEATDANRVFANAITADMNTKTLYVVADCE